MLFKPRHIDAIRDGEKTETRRVWADNYPRPNVGSVLIAAYDRDGLDKSPMFTTTEEADCFIRVTDIRREPLSEMTHEDAQQEGHYTSIGEFRDGWEEINGEGSWKPEQIVDVVEFEYVGRELPSGGDADAAV